MDRMKTFRFEKSNETIELVALNFKSAFHKAYKYFKSFDFEVVYDGSKR